MDQLSFIKMHGLGNDFVVLDGRSAPIPLSIAEARTLADRHFGIGCDQLIVMEPPTSEGADLFMRIRNPDGGEAEACGNATRCIASLVMNETGRDQVVIQTLAGHLPAETATTGEVTVDMGPANLGWQEIPLAEERDTLHLGIGAGPLQDPVGVNMGNPHAVFFVEDADTIDLATLGPRLEHDPLLPQRANISVLSVTGPDRLRQRVWERGAGITLACGSGACAGAVAAARRGLTGRRVETTMDGGVLTLEWREDGHVLMTGPVATSFRGKVERASLS
ncbi:diaminopimelate epimerase [Denitrobaculum tricleocarpae]|uniref:Diaminopimelate epimerase n=1 Tax=Denitrobaculum tricleocarpae TaxID=2591009 RepID=A0A545TQW4_9PROT|nr:diaminopimelate epimerase [Denitrobaculum tricleocarpae]TQV79612.1 diaminopimelate epimerase [Denitrobaculum tricleocarpae]